MKIALITLSIMMVGLRGMPQVIDVDLIKIRKHLDRVKDAKGEARLELEIDFINMPVKHAELYYQKGSPISYTSENFIIIPKRGLDFTWSELFRHEFMTLDRGMETSPHGDLKVLNVIPLDEKTGFAIMTIKLDTVHSRIIFADITTRNEGSYRLQLEYESNAVFPSNVIVEFELERIRIPVNFMGKDAEVERDKLKETGMKTGRILLELDWSYINME